MTRHVKRLHLGCGPFTPQGWINLDGSWNAWFAKHSFLRWLVGAFRLAPASAVGRTWDKGIVFHDVRNALPFETNSLSALYSSHMLEHWYLEETRRLLTECYRVLEPSGVLRMVVPDLRAIVVEYLHAVTSELPGGRDTREAIYPADELNHRLLFRSPSPQSAVLCTEYTALGRTYILTNGCMTMIR